MTENTESPASSPVEMEEVTYLVSLNVVAEGFDPVDAVEQALRRLLTEGLASQTFHVYDTEDDEVYVVPPGQENFHLLSDDEEDGEEVPLELDTLLERVENLLNAASEAGLIDRNAPDEIEDEEPEPEPEPVAEKPKRAPRKKATAKTEPATCARCKTENVTIVKDGLCQDCLDDIEGATA